VWGYAPAQALQADDAAPYVVFVTGDEEYRSEESMPMLARILNRDFGFRVFVAHSLDKDGYIDPNNLWSVSGIDQLDHADLMVLFTRFRDLPDDEFDHFLRYVDQGKPIVGFRTATHAFKFDRNTKHADWGWHGEKIAQLLGQNWITHHGHFSDGDELLTDVTVIDAQRDHPILRGFEPFQAYSWLYHVEGGGDHLRGDAVPLLQGRALKSVHRNEGRTERYPLTNPLAWTKTYEGRDGTQGRVFFVTAGHPYDFKIESMRRLALQGILWALGMEDRIPAAGVRADPVGSYDPPNSGTGNVYRHQVRPEW
jgi:type 1 glutamine amidotransferase